MVKDDGLIFLTLLAIAHFSRLSGSLAEYCLADRITDFHYWRKIEDQLQGYKNNEEDKLLNKLTRKLADKYKISSTKGEQSPNPSNPQTPTK